MAKPTHSKMPKGIRQNTSNAGQSHRTENILQERTRELHERIKELGCLYGISRFVERAGIHPIFPLDHFFSLFYSLTFKKLFFAVMRTSLIARSGPNPAGGLAARVILKTLGEVFAVWAGRIRGLEFKPAAKNEERRRR